MFNIMRNTKKIALIPIVIVIVGIVCLFINGGFATDIDFSGGTMMQINMGKDFKLDDVTAVIKESTMRKIQVQSIRFFSKWKRFQKQKEINSLKILKQSFRWMTKRFSQVITSLRS